MKKIAAIIDFSEMMDEVIRESCDLSRQLNAEIILLYMTPPHAVAALHHQSLVLTEEEYSRTVRLEKEKVQKIKNRLFEDGHEVSISIIDGTQVESLLERLEVLSPDYLIIATKTRSWIDDKVTGSHWTGIIHNCKFPIIILPPKRRAEKSFSRSELANICQKMRRRISYNK